MKMLVFLWVLFLFPTGYSEENLSFSGDIFHYGQVLDQSEEGFGESDYEIIEYIFNDTALPEDSNLSLARRKDRDPGTLIKGWGKKKTVCQDGEKREGTESCGFNGRGVHEEVCVEGQWKVSEVCLDPDKCVDGATRQGSVACDGGGYPEESCVSGSWVLSTPCPRERGVVITPEEYAALSHYVKVPHQGESKAEAVSDQWILITNVPNWDPANKSNADLQYGFYPMMSNAEAERPENYRITSQDDANYSSGAIPGAVGIRVWPLYAPHLPRKDLRLGRKIYLQFPLPVKSGASYKITMAAAIFGVEQSVAFTAETIRFGRAVHIHPYGFRPEDPKKAWIGMWMGTAGELPMGDTTLELVKMEGSNRRVVFSGQAQKGDYTDSDIPTLYEKEVYRFDFSSVKEPGMYMVKHRTLGYSVPFPIDSNAYRIPLATMSMGMLHQRSDEELALPYTRFVHGKGHPDDANVYLSSELKSSIVDNMKDPERLERINLFLPEDEWQNVDNVAPFYPTALEGSYLDTRGGHYDAGDYGKYTHNGAKVVWLLAHWLDLFKGKVEHDNLGMPFSENGIPDPVDELYWEIRWLKNMQDPEDGGVFTMVKPCYTSFQSSSMPDDTSVKRCLLPKDTMHTAAYAAALARASRNFHIRTYYPTLAEDLKTRAIRAWEFLEIHSPLDLGPYVKGDRKPRTGDNFDGINEHVHYGGSYGTLDERASAALELYALTGDTRYRDAFMEYYIPYEQTYNWIPLPEFYGYATRTLAFWGNGLPALDAQMQQFRQQALNAYRQAVGDFVKYSRKTPYGLSVASPIKRYHNSAWFFPVDYSYDLLAAFEHYGTVFSGTSVGKYSFETGGLCYGKPCTDSYEVFERNWYLDSALDQIYYMFGANPVHLSFVTGSGYSRIRGTVDHESLLDNIEQPVIGLPVSPMVNRYYYLSEYGKALSGLRYPSYSDFGGYLEENYDGWNVFAEFTIDNMSIMYAVLSSLVPVDARAVTFPRVQAEMMKEGSSYTASASIDGGTPPYQTFWYADGEVVSFSPNFTFVQNYDRPFHTLEVEVIDSRGARAWSDKVYASGIDPLKGEVVTAPLKLEPTTVAIFHLDQLDDSAANLDTLVLNGNAQLDSGNLYWMTEPRGASLRTYSIFDNATVTVDGDSGLLCGETVSEIQVEALVDIENLVDHGTIHGPVILLKRDWESQFMLYKSSWEKDELSLKFGKTEVDDLVKADVSSRLSPYIYPFYRRWHHVRMWVKATGYGIAIDGETVADGISGECGTGTFNIDCWKSCRDVELKFGSMDGWIDEVRISVTR